MPSYLRLVTISGGVWRWRPPPVNGMPTGGKRLTRCNNGSAEGQADSISNRPRRKIFLMAAPEALPANSVMPASGAPYDSGSPE